MAQHHPKFMVLSIDGVPVDLMQRMYDEGIMPRLGALAKQVGLRQMRSIQPCVSCVAWTCFTTGKNPGKHGIYGFIDRADDRFGLKFPNQAIMTSDTIFDILSCEGKRVFSMNVPCTYPPRKVNGIQIGGFLAPNLDKISYPATEGAYLKSIDYRLDNDAGLARQDKDAFIEDLMTTHKNRMEAMEYYLDQEDWDFFHTHIMGSDRACHFYFGEMLDHHPKYEKDFFDYFRAVDASVGKVLDRLPEDVPLMIFSDHGFCRITHEVQLSKYLIDKGWTTPAEAPKHPIDINCDKSKAYNLIPGRIFVNLEGREPGGVVKLEDYDKVRQGIKTDLLALTDPKGNKVIDRVVMREDLYWSDNDGKNRGKLSPTESAKMGGTYGKAADLVAIPFDGYDLKLGLTAPEIFTNSEMTGMHSYHDAFMVARGIELPKDNLEIMMLSRPILEHMGVTVPEDLDGIHEGVTPDLYIDTNR